MNKKILIGLAVILTIAVVSIGSYYLLKEKSKSTLNENKSSKEEAKIPTNSKTLVVYFSATGSTRKVAEEIAHNLNADLFEIEAQDTYTSVDLDWTDDNSRVSKEHNDESLRTVKLKNSRVDNWDNYQTVLIGYPIWWGIAAWPVSSFVSANYFAEKTIIPFCTSSSSGLGESEKLLEEIAKAGNWQNGKRFNSDASKSEIKAWTDSLK